MDATTGKGRHGLGRPAIVSALAVVLAGCGGGGGSGEPGPTPPPTVASPAPAGPPGGTVLLEHRRGRTTIEAWFSPLDERASVSEAGVPDWVDGSERCSLSERTASVPAGAPVSPPPVTLDAGDALTLSSRGGEHARLDAQRLGATRIYATAERWLADPLPDDLVLDVPGGPGFAASGGVPVPLVPAPVLLEPAGGALTSATDAVRWETATPGEDRIRLSLSLARPTGDEERAALSVIDCELDDDGTFELPDALVRRLPAAHGPIAVALARERTTRHALGESSVSLHSLAWP